MNMKKLAILALSLCMIAAVVVTGTVAYFTDTDEATNVFTFGNIDIIQNEQEREKDEDGNKLGTLTNFTQNQTLYPAVYEVEGGDPAKTNVDVNGYPMPIRNIPNYVDKIISVTNNSEISDAYVRVIIATPLTNDDPADGNVSENWLHTNCVTSMDANANSGWYHGNYENQDVEYDRAGSEKHYTIDNVTIGGKRYDLSVFTNIYELAPQASTGACFAGFYLDNDLDYDPESGEYFMPDENGNKGYVVDCIDENGNVDILVATQAVQADGFASAWQAFHESFGEITATNHPWAE